MPAIVKGDDIRLYLALHVTGRIARIFLAGRFIEGLAGRLEP